MASKMGRLSADGNKNVICVEQSVYALKLVGATCSTTLRPDVDFVRESFRIFPAEDREEELVLVNTRYGDDVFYSLIHIKRAEDGFITAKEMPIDVKDIIGVDKNYQVHKQWIELTVGNVRFTTDRKAVALHGEKVMVVDATEILKFIAGHIKVGELRANAVKVKARMSLEQQLDESERALETAERENAQLTGDKQQLEARIAEFARRTVPAAA